MIFILDILSLMTGNAGEGKKEKMFRFVFSSFFRTGFCSPGFLPVYEDKVVSGSDVKCETKARDEKNLCGYKLSQYVPKTFPGVSVLLI